MPKILRNQILVKLSRVSQKVGQANREFIVFNYFSFLRRAQLFS